MGSGRGSLERMKRASRTAIFIFFMVGSLLVSSAPLILTLADIITPCILLSTFGCCNTCFKFNRGLTYSFRSSLLDIPLLSFTRSVAIFCAYSICGLPSFTYGPYLATATLSGSLSTALLIVKTSVFTLSSDATVPPGFISKHSWVMPLLLLSSTALAVGHIVVAYRTIHLARRKSHLYGLDLEAVRVNKATLNGNQKSSPSTFLKLEKTGKLERDLPPRMLADKDSLFIVWQGIRIHYKKCEGSMISLQEKLVEREQLNSFKADNIDISSLRRPLLWSSMPESISSSCSIHPNEQHDALGRCPVIGQGEPVAYGLSEMVGNTGQEKPSSKAIILIHGFGGGVFSWRHIMPSLAAHTGWTVLAFDRPGWGLTSRPSKADWQKRGSNNPYELQSQIDLLLALCCELNFKSVVLVGHDDGGLLALMAAARLHMQKKMQIEVKGIVLIGVSLSREVVPPLARVLQHTSLGHHLLRRLLRSEIGQVTTRQAWYNTSKLTSDVLELYKVPLRVAGWDKALAEVSRASMQMILSPNGAAELLKLVCDLPALIVAGVQDILVPFQSAQVLAAQLPYSRLVPIASCGHLPHEESPGALLTALVQFLSYL